ncbi:Rgg/GadR/MutR family transcriptional regulator [Lacticaseibacillus suihuaensis]
MTHGELIRQLRQARGLTQAQLAAGITHRTTLLSFETHGTRIDFETMQQYLERLNVTLDEYTVLYNQANPSEKEAVRRLFAGLAPKLHQPAAQDWADAFLTRADADYQATQDIFYAALAATVRLTYAYRTNQFDASDPATQRARELIQHYLSGIADWGRFELSLFINNLFVFDADFVMACLNSTFHSVIHYATSRFFRHDLPPLFGNLLIYSVKANNAAIFAFTQQALAKQLRHDRVAELVVLSHLFDFITAYRAGHRDAAARTTLIDHLQWLGQTGMVHLLEQYFPA